MSSRINSKTKVYVAMSGGVDSSVAAALLKKQGYDVTGVFMKPWQPEISKYRNIEISSSCLWQKDREDAMRVAAKIGIPLLTWDFSKEYKKRVTDYMIQEYKAGRTPNPDVMCNKHIKFGLFLKKALKEGADYIATGHYVRIRPTTNYQLPTTRNEKSKKLSVVGCRLLVAADKNKDQSYFLWTLTQKQLKHCLFPIGDYIKPEVRKMAKKFSLPTANKKDSQGVCFIGPLDMKEFLKNYIKPKKGKIILTRSDLVYKVGPCIGSHDGVYYYTIGQRYGLNIKNGKGPYFVVKKDIKKNIIYVGLKKDLLSQKMKITSINWINPIIQPVDNRHSTSVIHRGMSVDIRVRYRAQLSKAVVKVSQSTQRAPLQRCPLSAGNGATSKGGELRSSEREVIFKKPETAVTPGQSAVFYKGEELLGGGIIM
ncbi:MAG: tRNA 2-thiouridine(34) synthase MnmA [Candidatus Yanofskybacteria bacterium RIFCSPHIGHO2_02_FULL_41_11]|uniref:tRNA-specific 2-thiouridylase MnmA n=1 Tax=Candidatus Yanofskybacteria bacterium RIFCSPHIGHO2_02_FULL_41_11 TaxID=1802675 RepID=A0A1F8F9Y0_9BACT|nr:MAG: tRNA 2-thiouridine(34) synthase MnmA [Candidatus Yanofskybacteria bacterium RIFCSPHIGHO2_02_FULL_41_11]